MRSVTLQEPRSDVQILWNRNIGVLGEITEPKKKKINKSVVFFFIKMSIVCMKNIYIYMYIYSEIRCV